MAEMTPAQAQKLILGSDLVLTPFRTQGIFLPAEIFPTGTGTSDVYAFIADGTVADSTTETSSVSMLFTIPGLIAVTTRFTNDLLNDPKYAKPLTEALVEARFPDRKDEIMDTMTSTVDDFIRRRREEK